MKYKLTFAQRRLWIEYKLRPSKAKYNLPIILKLSKNFKLDIFVKIWKSLLKTHQALRTSFVEEGGIPYQYVHDIVNVGVELLELPKKYNQKTINSIIKNITSYDFDLTKSPLYKLFLLQGETEQYLILLFHHIIMDGTSINILLSNISLEYRKYSGTHIDQKNITKKFSIKKYLSYEENLYQALKNAEADSFWQSYLSGAALSIDISDKIIKGKSERRHREYFKLFGEDFRLIQNYVTQNDGTIFIAISTIFMCLLYRYTSRDEIVITYPSGRRAKQFQENIGFFVNNIPLRLRFTEDLTFHQAFLQIKKDRSASKMFQDYPVEKIFERFRKNNSNTSDMFNIAVSASNFGLIGLDIDEVKCETLLPKIGSSGEDLTLLYEQDGNQITCALEYRTDLLTSIFIKEMIKVIKSFSKNLLINSKVPIASIALLNDQHKQHLIKKAFGKISTIGNNESIHNIFEQTTKKFPDKTAIIFGNFHLSYYLLNKQANQIARYLKSLGVTTNDVVGVALNRSANTIISILAVLKSGGAYLPIDIEFPMERIESIIQNSNLKYLIIDEINFNKYQALNIPFLINIDEITQELQHYSDNNIDDFDESPGSLAYIIYTSGSTGNPKGVAIKHISLLNYIKWADKYYPNSQRLVGTILHSSVAYDMSITSIFLPLVRGQSIIVLPQEQSIFSLKNQVQCCFIKLTPSHIKLIDTYFLNLIDCNSLIIGGEDLQYNCFINKKNIAARFFNEYGPTEATVGCSVYEFSKFFQNGKVPIGRPIMNAEIYILDKFLQPLPIGAIGEIYIGGAVLAKEYVNSSEMTKSRFIQNPFVLHKSVWLYKTGDLAKFLSTYDIQYLGRTDKQVKVRGYRIELEEINSTLENAPEIKHAVSILHDNQIVSYVVRHEFQDSSNVDLAKIRIRNWSTVYKTVYKNDNQNMLEEFVGWTSHYSNDQILIHEMEAWAFETAERILDLKPKKVLEIGSGTGIIVKRVAPHCSSYLATDLSSNAIENIKLLKHHYQELKHVEVIHEDAIGVFRFIKERDYDLIILNSVIQYFPDIYYLQNVVFKSLQILNKNGKIFIGDVRNCRLLDLYYSSVYAYRNKNNISFSQASQFIEESFKQEEELAIDPIYFYKLQVEIESIKDIKVQLKYGNYSNELNKFRYDVILDCSSNKTLVEINKWYNYQETPICIKEIETILSSTDKIGIRHIKNSKLTADIEFLNQIKGTYYDMDKGINPNDLKALANKMNFYMETNLLNDYQNGEYDIIFIKNNQSNYSYKFIVENSSMRFSEIKLFNNPLKREKHNHFTNTMMLYLNQKLPQYMIPSHINILDSLPINQNGKLEVTKLPLPKKSYISDYEINIMTDTERKIHNIWSKLLGMDSVSIGVNDNFFFLGGTSILLINLLETIRKHFSLELSLEKLFKNPTIKYISILIDNSSQGQIGFIYPKIHRIRNRFTSRALSFAQKRLWFLNHFVPNSAIYNMYLPIEVKGFLSIKAIRQSLVILSERHESFRTSVITDSQGDGKQVVKDNIEVVFEVLNIKDLVNYQTIEQLIIQKVNQSFDISMGPLIRVHVFCMSQNLTILLFVVHHIISDGYSQEILLKEFITIYNAIQKGLKPSLKQLKFQYIDFAEWQISLLQGEYINKQLEYWKNRLTGIPQELFSVTDYIRPKRLTYRGNTQYIDLSYAIYEKLRFMSQNNNVSNFNTCLAIFSMLMYIQTGQNDIVVGTPVSNRHYPNVENIIGFFSNTVPLRITIEEEMSFYELLGLVKERWSEALIYQDTPFEKLADIINLKGSLNINPIFQVEVIYQELNNNLFKLDGYEAKILDIHNKVSRFDLILVTKVSNKGLRYEIEYSEDLFSKNTIIKLLDALKLITTIILDNQHLKVNSLKELVKNHV